MKILITTVIVLLTTITSADFKSETYNWNIRAGGPIDNKVFTPDLVSLFTKEDVYIYQDIDIFGYAPSIVTDNVKKSVVRDKTFGF